MEESPSFCKWILQKEGDSLHKRKQAMRKRGNCKDTKCKRYFFDTGLLVSGLDEEAQEDLRANKNLGVYEGA